MEADTIDYVRFLYDKGFLSRPNKNSWWLTIFKIYKDIKKVNNCSFSRCNYKWKKKYQFIFSIFFSS